MYEKGKGWGKGYSGNGGRGKGQTWIQNPLSLETGRVQQSGKGNHQNWSTNPQIGSKGKGKGTSNGMWKTSHSRGPTSTSVPRENMQNAPPPVDKHVSTHVNRQ